MQWLEVVAVRMAGEVEAEKALALCRQVLHQEPESTLDRMTLYRSIEYRTDIGIHLHWQQADGKPAKSRLGCQLTRLLRDFGMIRHTLWWDASG